MTGNGGVPISLSRRVIEDVKRVLTEESKSVEEIAEAIQHSLPQYQRRAYRHSHIIAALEGMYFAGQVAKHWPSGVVGEGECRWHK